MPIRKRLAFSLVLILSSLLTAETIGHLGYRVIRGHFTWQRPSPEKANSVFRVRDYIRRVPDERFFTLKKSYRIQLGAWELATDENGFRIGRNSYQRGDKNIVFLGDSVPFGYGVDGRDSVPSRFHALLSGAARSYGVINAAVPSYSLDQAVQRYRYEIHSQFAVSHVVMQIYDPVSQFAPLLSRPGIPWNRKVNWYSESLAFPEFPPLRYSAIYKVFSRVMGDLLYAPGRVNNEKASQLFESENFASLDELYRLLAANHITLILLPVTPTKGAVRSEAHDAAVAYLNANLREYASTHARVHFFDVKSRLYELDPSDVFIDSCCHLSPIGAEAHARLLMGYLLKTGLLVE